LYNFVMDFFLNLHNKNSRFQRIIIFSWQIFEFLINSYQGRRK